MSKQSFSILVANKVFDVDAFNKVINLFTDLLPKRRQTEAYPSKSLSISAQTTDGISYEYNENDISEVHSLLISKKITSFKAVFFDRKRDTTFIVNLDDSKYGSNYFNVSSSDHDWLLQMRTSISDLMNDVRDQTNFYLSHRRVLKPLIDFILALPITFIILALIYTWAQYNASVSSPKPLTPHQIVTANIFLGLLMIALNGFIGSIFTSRFTNTLDTIWPTIEFDQGPKHLRVASNKRKILKSVFTTFVIPILLAIFLQPILTRLF